MEHLHVPDYQAEIDASFAQGSIGKAKGSGYFQEFAEMTENATEDSEVCKPWKYMS